MKYLYNDKISDFVDPELNNQFDELTDEDKEFLSKAHLSDALWMELWRGYFDFAARTLGLAPDESEEGRFCSEKEWQIDVWAQNFFRDRFLAQIRILSSKLA